MAWHGHSQETNIDPSLPPHPDVLIPIQIRPLSQRRPLEKDLVVNHTLRLVSLSLGRAPWSVLVT